MALLLPPGARVTTAAGVVISGGKVRVYNANTTTLSTLFSDATLSTPLTNPVNTNSAGYPVTAGNAVTLVFLADGNYDVAFLDASSVFVVGWEDVPALGADGASFTKDFTNSRFSIRGSGGTVYLEAGDATPDNVGGTMRIGGWNGTEADLITVDAALFNVDGIIKESLKKLQGVVQTEATTFSAVASVDIPLTNTPTGVRGWEITVFDLLMGSASTLNGRFSYDNGATYKSGAADYLSTIQNAFASGGTPVVAAATTTFMNLAANESLANTANRPGVIRMSVWTPNSGSDSTVCEGSVSAYNNTSGVAGKWLFTGFGVGAFGRATHFRLLANAGTMSGKYRVVPLRGTGDA
jgi:hypothetical protein